MVYLVALLIFLSRILDVTMMTFRTLMVVQGRRVAAAIFGFFEVLIYVVVLTKMVSTLDNPLHLFAYCLGYATGNFLGVTLDEKFALGRLSARVVVSPEVSIPLVERLREEGFGVTVIDGEGKDGPRKMLSLVFNRKLLKNMEQIIRQYDEKAFVVVNQINPISGGFIMGGVRK